MLEYKEQERADLKLDLEVETVREETKTEKEDWDKAERSEPQESRISEDSMAAVKTFS